MRITNLFWTVVLLAPLSVFAQEQKENLFTIDAQIRTCLLYTSDAADD